MSVPARSSSSARTPALQSHPGTSLFERLGWLRKVASAEGHAILSAASSLSIEAVRAAEMTANCEGCVMVTGVGKAGLVGQKLVATLASTGTPAHFLHPSEAIHGDLGRVRPGDIVWALSNSGRSEEVVRIAAHLAENSAGLIAITASDDNPLAVAADCVVAIGRHDEACPNGLAPTSSTAVMMAVGDAVAMLASSLRNFTPQDFARFHPGGSLGRKLATVDQVMRDIDSCRVCSDQTTIRDAMIGKNEDGSKPQGRRTGAIMLTDADGRLSGLFTDSDLARLLGRRDDASLDQPIATRMTKQPTTTTTESLLQEAMAVMSHRRISELPVIDHDHRPIGMIDITDIVALSDDDSSKILKL
ncbi:Arabinose 5-phosphate isomerase KpsF [Rubripirellula lacrimiformis]|uniref:Arabinose 5-phosphate isomerase KpsF n=1 Tax=Rubripirellula lacrimiformis TaxID=1930273 RepID=A0A517NCR2_9BACT|nr:KpsF/GutQ family sugar-phosphate isomerase [Rubripirellula lacrimiformis]QDT04924.1 Arabinose 5-phosphate isomerase KpsF [Rubripirellula lacrimiformis]